MTETSAKKKPGFFRRLCPTSVAGKAALATVCVLTLTLITVWFIRWFGAQRVAYSQAMTWYRMLIEFALIVIIPVVLYWGLRRWNQVIEGVYPDIDQAWQAGIKAMQAQGICVADHPIFLILGSSRRDLEQGLINASATQVKLQGIPDESGIHHTLQWYASPDAIYLFCSGTSSLSALMGRWTTPANLSGQRRSLPVSVASPVTQQVRQPPSDASIAEAPNRPEHLPAKVRTAPILGTLNVESMAANQKSRQQSPPSSSETGPFGAKPAPPPPRSSSGDVPPTAPLYFSTLTTNQLATGPNSGAGTSASQVSKESKVSQESRPAFDRSASANPAAPPNLMSAESAPLQTVRAPTVIAPRVAVGKLALTSALDTSDQLARLRYVCTLLRRIRRPRCGLNGIVTLFPFELSRAGPMQLSALAQSARGDVSTIQATLGIRSPLSAMLVGLEQDKGFNELVRRLQPELLSRRLGGRFDLRSRPTPAELNAHSDRLCDAFEDWVFRLFGREDALAQQRGNRKLYELISKIRHELKPRLRIVLGEAFGCEPNVASAAPRSDRSFFFSGCYFAASGASNGQPAFVKGVLQDKLEEEQSQVEWTNAALRVHGYFRAFAILGWVATGILAILLLVRLVWN